MKNRVNKKIKIRLKDRKSTMPPASQRKKPQSVTRKQPARSEPSKRDSARIPDRWTLRHLLEEAQDLVHEFQAELDRQTNLNELCDLVIDRLWSEGPGELYPSTELNLAKVALKDFATETKLSIMHSLECNEYHDPKGNCGYWRNLVSTYFPEYVANG
jgi:hypothetical protein